MKKTLILAIAIISLSQMAHSAEWEKYINGLYVDKTSITKDKDSISGWITQFNFGQYKKHNNKKINYVVQYMTAVCSEKKYTTHNYAYYDNKERLIYTYNGDGKETYTRAYPNTYGESMLNALCSYK